MLTDASIDPEFSRLSRLIEGQEIQASHQPIDALMQSVRDRLDGQHERSRYRQVA